MKCYKYVNNGDGVKERSQSTIYVVNVARNVSENEQFALVVVKLMSHAYNLLLQNQNLLISNPNLTTAFSNGSSLLLLLQILHYTPSCLEGALNVLFASASTT